ncbi:PREDICTED: synaptotagmin-like protein 4 isoform X1 [Branchiostoma belcheri]|uniref:Synaptotagmin-like protein 4 isoform X1 n=1 Tax=Branchiostoma belcheri TaxID=7741 RepID=A0A6P4YJM3_BRABE|nr:PREDICTED: synaptotagmin-like protein 4 isoform X1 [Branchiostoma belcheri]
MASFNPFKHLKPQDREVRSSGDLHEMYKTMAAMIDLSHLSEEEKEKILQVLQRDEDLRKVEERRITRRKSELGSELEDGDSKLKKEFQEVKKKSAVKTSEAQNSEKNCSRCQTAFGFFFDTGDPCPQCQHKVCNSCREFTTPKKDKWLCALCNKQRLLKIETGEWFYETMDPKKKDQLFGTDLIRASLRRPRGRGRGRPQPVGDQIRPALTGSRERVQDVGRSPGRGRDRTAQQSPRRDGKTDPQAQNHLAPEESHTNFYRKIAEIDNGPALPSRSSASLPRDTMMSRTSPRVSSDSGRSSPLLVGSNRNPSKPVPLNRRMQPSRKQMSLDDELHLVCAEEEKKTSRYHDVAFPKKSDTELLDELVSAGDYSTSESLVRRYSSDSTASYSSGPSSPQMSVRAWLNAQEASAVHTTTDVPTPTTASETNSLQNYEDIPDNRPSNWNGSTTRDELDAGRGEYIDDGRSSTGHGPTQRHKDEPDRRAINATLPQGTRAEVDVHHHHNEDRVSRAHGTPPAKNRSIPTVAVEDSKEITRYPSSRDLEEFEDEDIDAYVRQYGSGSEKSASGSQRGSSLGASMSGSRESIMSYYSDAGDGYYGNIEITGDILLSLDYNFKNMVLAVHIKKCRDLAVADEKKKKSDPYVKTYLLPDKTKSGKRKTKVRKHTSKPTYDEVLKYSISPSELETRTLWASVWHNDMFGRNTFLGEVHLPLDNWDWDDRQARWYQLQQPVVPAGPKSTFQQYKGDLVISMKYVPSYKLLGGGGDTSRKGRRKTSPDRLSQEAGMGELHVFIKEARNLMAVRANGSSDPFVKGYLLPDKSKQSKQKTPYIKRNCNPTWNHTFVYKSVNPEELEQRCLELTVWDYDRMTSNDFLGGVRLSLGNRLGQPIEWMDSQGEEITAWRTMLNKPNVWVDSCLLLRPSMDYRVRPSTPAPSTTS